jgi:hypothetical protein
MINIHIYGFLRKKFNPEASLTDEMKIQVNFSEGIRLLDVLQQIEVTTEECGECFVNGTCVQTDSNPEIVDESRIAIFSEGMYLLCGGQHLKGHGFITKAAPKKYDYFHVNNR